MFEGKGIKSTSENADRVILITVLLLLGFGVVMVYSASAVRASQVFGDGSHFLLRQIVYASVGLVGMFIASQINYRIYKKLAWPLLALAFIALLMVHTPLGRTINGSSRWIGAGPITIQPGEFAKIALVIWLAYSLAKKRDKIKTFSVGFLPHLLIPGCAILLCLSQPDFGTSVVIAVMVFALLFIAGAKLGYIMLASIAVAPIAYYLVAGSEYRWKRIMAFVDPISNRYGDGYQLTQSLFGFSKGGISGVGLGDGLQKFFFLPEAHNDFVASIVGEELGMIGIWILITLFAVLIYRGVRIAVRASCEFGTYCAFGITVLLGVQALANLGVAMGLLPTKGLNLPFVSYGGSALVIALCSVGILLNISKHMGTEEEMAPIKGDMQTDRAKGNVRRKVAHGESV